MHGRLPRGAIVFDAVPRWLAERSRRGKVDGGSGYRPPPWTWGLDRAERRRLARLPGIEELRLLRLPRGRGVLFGAVLPLLATLPPLRGWPLGVLTARFSSAETVASRAGEGGRMPVWRHAVRVESRLTHELRCSRVVARP